MNYAEKLIEKLVSPLDAWEEVPHEDPKDLANAKSLVRFDDFRLAVLEKNKEIDIARTNFINKNNIARAWNKKIGLFTDSEQARAFRELVEAVEKVKQK